MIVGTTPTHKFDNPVDVSDIAVVRIVYKQGNEVVLVKEKDDCVFEDGKIIVTLEQEDTFKFDHNAPYRVQARILTTDGLALATIPRSSGVTECLENVVMVWE